MAAPIQATMFFKQGKSGWSEVLVMDSAKFKTLQDANTEVTRQGGLGQRRVALLGDDASLIGIRLSKFGVWRDSLYTANAAGQPPGKIWLSPAPSTPAPAVNPWDAITVRLECGESYRRLVYLSGVPDVQYSKPDPTQWGSQFQDNWGKYFDYLTGQSGFTPGNYGTMVSSKDTSDPPPKNISTQPNSAPTLSNATNQSQITLSSTDNTFKVVQGQKVRILGVRGQPGIDLRKWNGIFTVINGNIANQFTIAAKINSDAATFAKLDWTQAYVWVPTPVFQPFTNWEFEGKTHRKRGVAFGTPRGRSRSRD